MPERIRYSDIALGLATALFLALIAFTAYFVFYSKGYQAADKRHEAENAARYAAEQHYQECIAKPTVKEAVECYKNAEKAGDEARRSEQDLNAQREMADWAEGMLWATAIVGTVTIAVTGLGVYWVRETLVVTREAMLDTRKIGQAQVRAYLSIVESTLSVRADGSGVETRLQIRNFGNSPAKAVNIAYRVGIVVDLSDMESLRDSGPMVISALDAVFGESIASGTTTAFNHFHGNFQLTDAEMAAIATQVIPPQFLATMTIRFLDVFDQEIKETQHRTAMLQAVGTTLPFFQAPSHHLSWRIDRERGAE